MISRNVGNYRTGQVSETACQELIEPAASRISSTNPAGRHAMIGRNIGNYRTVTSGQVSETACQKLIEPGVSRISSAMRKDATR